MTNPSRSTLLRFFLQSIDEQTQDGLLSVIGALAQPGDLLCAEFRSEQDKANKKVHGNHYRRYQNGPAFVAMLTDRCAFQILDEQEGTGLSPYQDEDPHLYRVVSRRT